MFYVVAPKEKSKRVGKYSVYLWEHYDTFYNSRGTPRRGKFENGEVAVFISGKEKSLQRSEDYNSKEKANRTYRNLSSVERIKKWIE